MCLDIWSPAGDAVFRTYRIFVRWILAGRNMSLERRSWGLQSHNLPGLFSFLVYWEVTWQSPYAPPATEIPAAMASPPWWTICDQTMSQNILLFLKPLQQAILTWWNEQTCYWLFYLQNTWLTASFFSIFLYKESEEEGTEFCLSWVIVSTQFQIFPWEMRKVITWSNLLRW